MSFKKNKYTIIRKAISKDLATFLANYFSMKKQVYDTCLKHKYVSPFERLLGWYETEDAQIPNTYSCYADIAMETMMLKCQPGDILHRHKDRFSCEISTTMNLGGDDWPIYLSPNENVGLSEHLGGLKGITTNSKAKGIKIQLKPGDMLVYRGQELEHWREEFKGKECIQVFLHYNDIKTSGAEKNMFDRRLHLGLPPWFKDFKFPK
mgnify:FL=1